MKRRSSPRTKSRLSRLSRFVYRTRGGGAAEASAVAAGPDGNVCVALPSTRPQGGSPDNAVDRYVVVTLRNGVTPGPLVLHLYDLGPSQGLRLVGIERPEGD